MSWRRLGCIFNPEEYKTNWYTSHAALPIARLLDDLTWRIYFSARDEQNRAQIGYFDLVLSPKPHVINVSKEPVLRLGTLGTFDDHGVTGGCLVERHGVFYFYYTGWTLGVTVPFYFYTGLAVGNDTDGYKRQSLAPLLPRSSVDPYINGVPSIVIEDDVWNMWYISATHWEIVNGSPRHFYLPKYAHSEDGLHWQTEDKRCLEFGDGEYAFSRPHVIKEDGIYKMWYAVRGDVYRLGYAESTNRVDWVRKDHQAGLDVAETGWDAEMIAYPHRFNAQGQRYLLYNGNGYGRTGIGLAVWEG
jgi:hypothetical protein